MVMTMIVPVIAVVMVIVYAQKLSKRVVPMAAMIAMCLMAMVMTVVHATVHVAAIHKNATHAISDP